MCPGLTGQSPAPFGVSNTVDDPVVTTTALNFGPGLTGAGTFNSSALVASINCTVALQVQVTSSRRRRLLDDPTYNAAPTQIVIT